MPEPSDHYLHRCHQRTVKIAMLAVRVVQVTVDKEIDMVAVRHGLMPAVIAMRVQRIVPAALVRRRT